MAEDDLIMRMARAHYEVHAARPDPHTFFARWSTWAELPQEIRDQYYDQMWEALKLLREPTDEMLGAANASDWSAYPLGESHVRLFTVMIDKLLEVK